MEGQSVMSDRRCGRRRLQLSFRAIRLDMAGSADSGENILVFGIVIQRHVMPGERPFGGKRQSRASSPHDRQFARHAQTSSCGVPFSRTFQH